MNKLLLLFVALCLCLSQIMPSSLASSIDTPPGFSALNAAKSGPDDDEEEEEKDDDDDDDDTPEVKTAEVFETLDELDERIEQLFG